MTPLLEVSGLEMVFGGRGQAADAKAVDGVSFDIASGETLGLVGESGSGKSTTGFCVMRLLEPTAGSIRFNGTELVGLSRRAMRRHRSDIQIIFQDPYSSLNPRMSVGQLIAEPLVIHKMGTARTRRDRAHELLSQVGLDARHADSRPFALSGGQRQRVAIARALTLSPQLLVCDEPVSAVDVMVQAQIVNLLRDLQEQLGLSYLFISHDLGVIRAMSDRVAVMQHGRIVEHGSAAEVFSAPQHDYTRRLLQAVPTASGLRAP